MQPSFLIFIAIFLPMLGSPLAALLGRRLKGRVAWFALAFPLVSLAALVKLYLVTAGGATPLVSRSPWIPTLGINASFVIDRLSLFYGLVVSGVGAAVIYYARHYLGDRTQHQGRFFSYLLLFMSAMLGTVLSNNLMLLFVFWELTGLASFLLIGFSHHNEKSRAGARMALLVTGFTGLLMMAGIILLGNAQGSFELDELLKNTGLLSSMGGLATAAMVLVLLGAFGKSAQFPFHFWLPNAMAAPTPVSAYLHSATMVKLGVFLVGRFYPLLSSLDLWQPLLLWVGFLTMALGAVFALLSHDLKAILAYSTVSQLGFLIGLYGMGTGHDLYHITNHVFYKGSLFMVAGIVDHAAGTRNVRNLGGLGRHMPMAFAAALLAGAAMMALPGTSGFISKELMLEQAFHYAGTQGGLAWLWPAAGLLTSACLTAFTLRIVFNIFTGEVPEGIREHLHAPSPAFQAMPLLLALGVLVAGLAPGFIQALLPGSDHEALHIWHGLGWPFYTSLAGWGLGWLLWKVKFDLGGGFKGIPAWLRFDHAFEASITAFTRMTGFLANWIRVDRPMDYLPIIITFLVALVGGYLLYGADYSQMPIPDYSLDYQLNAMFVGLVAVCVTGVVFMRRWTTRLIALSTVGFLVTFYFMICRAPDLALTQMLIETATLILMLLLLGRFPESAERNEIVDLRMTGRKLYSGALALSVGTIMFFLVTTITNAPHPEPMGPYFLATTVELAGGANAVNTVLVDYRGFDTMGEITVLVISLLGALGLFMRWKEGEQ